MAKDSPSDSGPKYGDIIVVRPDGWTWGREECPPTYTVFKLPGVSEEEAKQYEESINDEDGNLIKLRRFSVDALEVDDAKTKEKGVKEISVDKIKEFKEEKVKDKTK